MYQNQQVLDKIKNGLVNDKVNLNELQQVIKELTQSTKLLNTDLPAEQKQAILTNINETLEKVKKMAPDSALLQTIITSIESKVSSAKNLLNSAQT